ncbi:MAG: SpoIID/LytB domain-containing protein [Propionicimonas sp.]
MATTTAAARRGLQRCLAGLATVALAAGGAIAAATPAAAAEKITVKDSTLIFTTAGWGHGRGMSQYGAQGAAKQGLKHTEILKFYYPGTKLEELKKGDTIRVWITADTDQKVHVYAAKGLRVRDAKGKTFTLPTGKNYTKWRLSRSGSKTVLYHRNSKGKYVKYTSTKLKLDPKQQWSFENPDSGKVKLYLASGNRTYRGTLALGFHGKGARTVNHVSMEDYLRSVVPAEMPASWHAEALKAQSVAARSYAARYRANLGGKQVYDICNTTSCQVYKGTMSEHSATDKAIKATVGQVLTYQNQYAWTEFSSSNGGYSVAGPNNYIKAKADPYDEAMKQIVTTKVKVSTIEKKYPKIGKLKSITLERDGKGRWGGRVTQVTLTGSKASQKVAGTSFKSALGLRETLFTIGGSVAEISANYLRWEKDFGGAKGTLLGAKKGEEQSIDGGLYAPFEKGALWYSKATGSHRLSPAANALYLELGGPAKSELGFPKIDEGAVPKNLVIDGFTPASWVEFQSGSIACKAKATKAADCTYALG